MIFAAFKYVFNVLEESTGDRCRRQLGIVSQEFTVLSCASGLFLAFFSGCKETDLVLQGVNECNLRCSGRESETCVDC